MAPRTDDPLAALARAAAGGDRAALRELLQRVGPSMSAAIRRMVPPSELEDAVQEALLGLVRALPAFRYESTVKHFACRVAVRSATVFNRTRGRRGRADDRGRDATELAAPVETPLERTEAARRREVLRDLCERLPAEQAEALSLRIVMGCSLQEVADATDAPLNTVRSRLRLAKDALRKRIEAEPRLRAMLEPDR